MEIKVKPSTFPISYHGEFHYRSGATKQQLTGTTLRIRFKALESALIDQPNTPNRQGGGLSGGIDGGLAERIIELIRANNTITVLGLSEALETPKRTVEREMKKLRDSKRIKREGGNRYGHWEVH